MLAEIRTGQLLEYKKLLTKVLTGIDSAIRIRSSLLENNSVSEFEIASYDRLHDPERYYHIKLFDMAISIFRLFDKKQYLRDDPDDIEFHFCIRCYNYEPKEKYDLLYKRFRDYVDIGDFDDIDSSLKYFRLFARELMDSKTKVLQSELEFQIF